MNDQASTDEKRGMRTTSIVIIAIVASCAAFYFGRAFFVPIVFAVLLTTTLVLLRWALPNDTETAGDWLDDGGRRDAVVLALNLLPFAGWAVYLHEGKLTYCHNLLGLNLFKIGADSVVPGGTHQVRVEFAYDGGGLAKGGDVTLYVDGDKVGAGRVDATVPMLYSADETCDLGSDTGTAVSDDYLPEDSHFSGTVNWVQLDAGNDDHDHLVSPEERWQVAMARQ